MRQTLKQRATRRAAKGKLRNIAVKRPLKSIGPICLAALPSRSIQISSSVPSTSTASCPGVQARGKRGRVAEPGGARALCLVSGGGTCCVFCPSALQKGPLCVRGERVEWRLPPPPHHHTTHHHHQLRAMRQNAPGSTRRGGVACGGGAKGFVRGSLPSGRSSIHGNQVPLLEPASGKRENTKAAGLLS